MSSPPTSKPLTPDAFKSYCVYQIYPSSFCDSNGDGIGDLAGIKSKLAYIKSLGTDVIWLSPIYKSPQKDMGYDISDYEDIDERYGTLQDWDVLKEEVHKMDMKLIMDLVVNHTSDQHKWFKESRSSKNNPKRDWYIWKPAKCDEQGNRKPPNNWAGAFGGSMWEWDEETQEYYFHVFAPEQPDLNWENPDVRQAIWKMMRWWMDRGSDGFRMDVINVLSKTPGFPDAEITQPDREYQEASQMVYNGPNVHGWLQEMHREVLSKYPNYFTVGETPCIYDPEDVLKYVHPDRKELQMLFLFEFVDLDRPENHPIYPRIPTLPKLKAVVNKWQTFMFAHGGWNSLYMENHDQARSVSRFLGFGVDEAKKNFDFGRYEEDLDKFWSVGAKLLAILHTTQGGTVFVYQGEEIGSTNVPRSWPLEEYKDVATVNLYREELERRKKAGAANPDMTDILDGINRKARDNARVPVQWDDSPHAGFTTGTPWMRVNDNYKTINRMIRMRKEYPVLIYGDFSLLSEEDERIFAYTRQHNDVKVLVVLNFSRSEANYEVPESVAVKRSKIIGGNRADDKGSLSLQRGVKLGSFEGQVWLLSA
ncbi:alpha-amylase [Ceratobasidium sp. AG-Ba]|nr:alpha-amylase [Ceratobasidium sp. AG-Ba]